MIELDEVVEAAEEELLEDAVELEVAAELSDGMLCETELVPGFEVAARLLVVLETGEDRVLELGSREVVVTVVGVVPGLEGLEGLDKAIGVELEEATTEVLDWELWDGFTPAGELALKLVTEDVSTVLPEDGCGTEVLGVVACGVLELVKAGIPLTEVHPDQLCDPPYGWPDQPEPVGCPGA